MELIRGLHNLRPAHKGCVATIGTFDGVHLGHRAVIDQLIEIAKATGLPALLMTFEPQPREFFTPQGAPARLTRLGEKLRVLATTSIERVLVVRFDESFAALSPQDFIHQVLVDGLGIAHLVVGDDFRFGRDGEGDLALLRQAGERYSFQVVKRDTFLMHSRRVSSGWVRDELREGRMDAVAKLLNRPYGICGRVLEGERLGRSIGFPTANIALRRLASPIRGVYAVLMRGVADRGLPGVANVGTRPTVDGGRSRIEVHAFDFSEDIYGRYVEIEFLKKLRDERRFDSVEALKKQIRLDAQQAREFLGRYGRKTCSWQSGS